MEPLAHVCSACVQVTDARTASAAKSGGADQDDDDDDLCVVCWDRAKEVIFLPCGHMVRPFPRMKSPCNLWNDNHPCLS